MSPEPTVRAERVGEAGEVARVVGSAFGEGNRARGVVVADLWAEVVSDGLAFASLVAELEGSVVGHVGLSHAWLDARRELVDIWLLSPLSVVPGYQRRGVGSALLAAAVETAHHGAAPMLVLEGSPDYYGARGFERASAHGIAPASVRTPDAASQVVIFDDHQAWMTGQVIYHDVWWRHDAAGLRDPRLAELEERFAHRV